MTDTVRAFYDDFADDYHLIFADWEASIARQAGVLDSLIRPRLGPGDLSVLDCACGIGTQAIGLARLGYRVQGSDLSPRAIARARREAATRNLEIGFAVADLRRLADQLDGAYDVVMACDNALPHLLTDADLSRAVAQMASRVRPGGLFLASIRDYDQLTQIRPVMEDPRLLGEPGQRRVSFQIWEWQDDGGGYTLHQFLHQQDGGAWRGKQFSTPYRALLRADLDRALIRAGLTRPTWLMPDDSGYYQPLVIAERS